MSLSSHHLVAAAATAFELAALAYVSARLICLRLRRNPSSLQSPEERAANYVPTGETVKLFRDYVQKMQLEQLLGDAEKVRTRVVEVFFAAYKSYPYRCIEHFAFPVPRVTRSKFYAAFSTDLAGKNIMDFGCCMGTDLRKMILDGAEPSRVFGVDINLDFINIGLDKLFQDRPIMQNRFFACDMLSSPLLWGADGTGDPANTHDDVIARLIKELEEKGGLDAVFSSAVFHLFDKRHCEKFAQTVYALLSRDYYRNAAGGGVKSAHKPRARPGVFFGQTSGSSHPVEPMEDEPDDRTGSGVRPTNAGVAPRYLHSPVSLKRLLEEAGFVDVSVSSSARHEIDLQRPRERQRAFLEFVAFVK